MNSLLLFENDFVSSTSAILKGKRAREVKMEHDLIAGLEISVAKFNGLRGKAKVHKCETDEIELLVTLDTSPPKREPCELIVAIPRPQTIKKVIQLSASVGVEALHFVPSKSVQASYLQSKSLMPENIEREMHIGMQQAVDCVSPKINVHDSFKNFIKETLPKMRGLSKGGLKLCAHTLEVSNAKRENEACSLSSLSLNDKNTPIILSIGPEAGWTNDEVRQFSENGFRIITLGERIYRVETALALLLGQIMLLREQSQA